MLQGARSYGEGAQRFYENIGSLEAGAEKPKQLLILITSDRGLCGAVHSSIAKVCLLVLFLFFFLILKGLIFFFFERGTDRSIF